MSALIENSPVTIPQRQALLKGLPCFAMLSDPESHELAALMVEESYTSGQEIVIEEELVDRVYILVQGQAEVTHQVIIKKALKKAKVTHAPVAVIGPGDAIGLNDTGFFSTTGKRTATVTATTLVQALALDLKALHQFLEKYPHLQSAMHAATTQMLRMRLIKQSLSFARLSHERIQWLAAQVEEISVPAGTVIFKQGEKGDRCYLIRSGQVEIIATDEGAERRLAVLKPPTLFGEATMITHDPRNATARTLEKTELLALQHKHLSELIETESNVANMFMTLMVDRSRPLQNTHVTKHQRTTADGQEIIILKNPDNGSYFKLSAEGWFIWQQLNGKQTMHAITMALANEFNLFAPDVVVGIISKLAKAGCVINVDVEETAVAKAKQPKWLRALASVRRLLEIRYAFGDADKWLTKAYQQGAHLLFTRLGKILLSLLALSGFVTFAVSTSSTIETFKIMPNVWVILVLLIPCMIFSVALHELGHAFATKHYGREVHYMGVGWFWTGPVAFTDTSDMWLSPRGSRIIVNLAGIFTDVLVAGASALLILLISNPYIQAFFWLFALYTYINAFRMLSPLQEMDGYYALMDVVEKPHLRQAAVIWLVKKFPKALCHPSLFKQNKPEIIYWLACLSFIVSVSILTLLMQTFIFKILGLHASNPYLSLSIPVLVALVSSLGIIGDIRNQAE